MSGKQKQITSTFILLVLLLAGTMIASNIRKHSLPRRGRAYTHAEIALAEAGYMQTGSTEDLLKLLEVLIYQEGGERASLYQEKIKMYGQELLSRARKQEIDLEVLDAQNQVRPLLSAIREAGAT